MEELRLAVIKLQKNFKERVVTENTMKDALNCHSKNMETLKSLTLTINERVGVLEDIFNNKNTSKDDQIVEKMESVKKYLKNLETKMDSVEDKLVNDIESTAARIDKDICESNDKQKHDRKKLKELLEDNKNKLQEVEKNLLVQKETVKKQEQSFKCEKCGETFVKIVDRRNHIKLYHPKQFSCDFCDVIFNESWQYEMHLESHSKTKDKKCGVCGKAFFLEWRFRQHVNVHENPNIKNCHYYNNNKVCPFDTVGCKFKHVKSKQCKNPTNCKNKLCSMQHL